MGDKTKIEWCDSTINPIQDKIKGESGRGYHCTKYSLGCLNCYAEGINNRFGNHLPFDGRKAEFEIIESELHRLAKWKKPRNVFVQSMGDLFHEDVPFDFIRKVIFETGDVKRHTFLFLTKRVERMRNFWRFESPIRTPLKNMFNGVTICNQDEIYKLRELLNIPGNKFISTEPLLSSVIFDPYELKQVSGVILGGETGPKARPMNPDWAISVVRQCRAAGVPVFVKQIHINGKSSKDMNEWPEELRVRDLPRIVHN